MGKSTVLSNWVLDFLFRGGKFPGWVGGAQVTTINSGAVTAIGPSPILTLYVALYQQLPAATGTAVSGTEAPSGVGYARYAITLGNITPGANTYFWPTDGNITSWQSKGSGGTSSPGSVANSTSIIYASPTGMWNTITGFGIVDSGPAQGTAGNLWYVGSLATPLIVYTGGPPVVLPAGTLQIAEG